MRRLRERGVQARVRGSGSVPICCTSVRPLGVTLGEHFCSLHGARGAMESDDEGANPGLRSDIADLWAAVSYLGEEGEELDLATDTVVRRFKRREEWREALAAIRKLLKKYHGHEALPVRAALHKWGVFEGKLLPMIQRYHADR